jgi:cholesterol transport system auxiliary component
LLTNLARASAAGVFVPADGVRAAYTLRLELEEFSQVFDAPERSRALLRLRASLVRKRDVVAQRSFNVERAAATPNAEGGVRALIAASDTAGEQLIDWLAAKLKR